MKNNIDDAFIRRFNDIVKFSVPNEEERKEIWEKSFPKNADYGDIPNHVKRYEISGGNIINTIHYAGIQAVRRNASAVHNLEVLQLNGSNGMETEEPNGKRLSFYIEDIIEGIRREMIKEGKPFSV
jgi:SpoVK/Ycf46/Vps4 family AAA+-type ATPase